MAYSEKVIDHYENPRNVGKMNAEDPDVGTGIRSAQAGVFDQGQGDVLFYRQRRKQCAHLKQHTKAPFDH